MGTELHVDHDAYDPLTASKAMRLLQCLLEAMAAVGTIWIAAIMLLIVADVVGRNFLQTPVTGVAEIAARSVVAIVFLMLPAAALKGTLIRADFLIRMVPARYKRVLDLIDFIFSLLAVAICFIMAWSAWPDTYRAWKTAEFFGVRGVWTLPTLPFRIIVVIGSFAAAVAFLANLISRLTQNTNRKAS